MHADVKQMRAAIKHIDGAWCRRWQVHKDGKPTGEFVLRAGHRSGLERQSREVAEALRAAGYECAFSGEPGTSGEWIIEVTP